MQNSEWILVTDELPPINKLVLCQGGLGKFFLGVRNGNGLRGNKVYMHAPNEREGRYAVAWHPLPQPMEIRKGR